MDLKKILIPLINDSVKDLKTATQLWLTQDAAGEWKCESIRLMCDGLQLRICLPGTEATQFLIEKYLSGEYT